jgi:hypothetical protein
MLAFSGMGEYRVTVIRKARYMVSAESAEMAQLRVSEDEASLDAIDRDTEVLVEPLTLTPTPVPEEVNLADEGDSPHYAVGAETPTN